MSDRSERRKRGEQKIKEVRRASQTLADQLGPSTPKKAEGLPGGPKKEEKAAPKAAEKPAAKPDAPKAAEAPKAAAAPTSPPKPEAPAQNT